MARIKDVAREAGVAASTVSLVLNNKGYVSAATRRKIEAAMEKLRYVPSEVARNLSLSRTKTVGVIVPSVSHPFFSELLESLESALYALGYKTLLCCTKEKDNAERAFLDMLRRKTMDGIIMGAHTLDTALYANLDRPIIAFDRFLPSCTRTTNTAGGSPPRHSCGAAAGTSSPSWAIRAARPLPMTTIASLPRPCARAAPRCTRSK